MDTQATGSGVTWEKLPNLPDAEGYAGMYAGEVRDVHTGAGALVAAGGANFPEKPLWEGERSVGRIVFFCWRKELRHGGSRANCPNRWAMGRQ